MMPINYDVEYPKLRMKYGKALQKIEELEALMDKDFLDMVYKAEALEAALRHIAEGTWWDGNEPWEFHRVESYALAALQRNE